ncbi:10844_t:CDS:1 [Funneliformis geosporum]|uniref:2457_t:CDS:1 n=1 Tax=Funneliformis geosporum TaxID=1117311 RepID=A0A9W4WT95_9GLOM|nr:10844_t:CDS:1 [Funneliformis geosporum]CAI2185261.1 2457_t:CDS:1 [Funneliformis geosporum]
MSDSNVSPTAEPSPAAANDSSTFLAEVSTKSSIEGTSIQTPLPETTFSVNFTNSINSAFKSNTLIFILIPTIVFLVIALTIAIICYKRSQKKQKNGTILQFEPMHPHVVVVDADGNSLGKRSSSITSSSNNSLISNLGGTKNQNRMIKVIAYDNDDHTKDGSIKSNDSKRKTMYYEDYRRK